MAEMIPDSIGFAKNATKGEVKVYNLFKQILLPDNEWWVWYEPSGSVRQKHGDFLILSLRHGIILVEVKDWSVSYIQSANPDYFMVKQGEEAVVRENPINQARYVQLEIRNLLEKRKSLTQNTDKYKGKLKFPTTHCVIFTHMKRSEAEKLGLLDEHILSHKKCLFKDDLDIDTNNKEDTKEFVSHLLNTFDYRFPFEPLSEADLNAIRHALFPEIRINPPKNLELELILNDDELINVLDRQQESIAKSLGPGHRILKGVAGSGKSLVATYRAQHLAKMNPDWNILVVCFNITLRGHLGASLNDAHLQAFKTLNGTGYIEVKHYHSLLKDLTGIKLLKNAFPNWEDYTKESARLLMDYVDKHDDFRKFDAIIIDEGQDFSEEMLASLLKILNDSESLLFCFDPAQNMFGRKRFSWKFVGLNVQGKKTTILNKSYRNTKPILELCTKFKGEEVISKTDEENGDNQALVPNINYCRDGDKPKLISTASSTEMLDYIVNDVVNHIQNGTPLNEFAVIIMESSNKTELSEVVSSGLKQRLIGLGFSENVVQPILKKNEKMKLDLRHESIKILMTDSCKGLEFKVVYFVGLGAVTKETDELRKTAYVGMTRAKEYLNILYAKNHTNIFLEELRSLLNSTTQ